MAIAALELTVWGAVQGVGFRSAVRQQAQILGLTGTVSNNADGSVRVHAEGDRLRLQAFFHWCYTGVRSARVDRIQTSWAVPTRRYQDFVIATFGNG